MPEKEWTSQADWSGWSVGAELDTSSSPGDVLLNAGESIGVLISPAYQAAGWVRWAMIELDATIPTGANVYARAKVAATQGGLAAASWSDYVDGHASGGTIQFNLGVYLLNNPPAAGVDWMQVEITLERG